MATTRRQKFGIGGAAVLLILRFADTIATWLGRKDVADALGDVMKNVGWLNAVFVVGLLVCLWAAGVPSWLKGKAAVPTGGEAAADPHAPFREARETLRLMRQHASWAMWDSNRSTVPFVWRDELARMLGPAWAQDVLDSLMAEGMLTAGTAFSEVLDGLQESDVLPTYRAGQVPVQARDAFLESQSSDGQEEEATPLARFQEWLHEAADRVEDLVEGGALDTPSRLLRGPIAEVIERATGRDSVAEWAGAVSRQLPGSGEDMDPDPLRPREDEDEPHFRMRVITRELRRMAERTTVVREGFKGARPRLGVAHGRPGRTAHWFRPARCVRLLRPTGAPSRARGIRPRRPETVPPATGAEGRRPPPSDRRAEGRCSDPSWSRSRRGGPGPGPPSGGRRSPRARR